MYLNIDVSVLLNAIGLAKDTQLSTADLNVFRGLLYFYNGYECARLKKLNPQYLFPQRDKLVSFTGYSKTKVGRSISSLYKSGLITSKTHLKFNTELLPEGYEVKEALSQKSSRRLSALPTFFLRDDLFTTKGNILSFLTLVIRCCWQKRGVLNYVGRVKVSSIMEATGLAKRTIQNALTAAGKFFTITENEPQWVLNNHGTQFSLINHQEGAKEEENFVNTEEPKSTPRTEIDPISAPLKPQIDPISAPPYKQENSSTKRSKYQRITSGVSLRDIKREDLEKPKRLYQLFKQAREIGLTSDTESSRIQFVALAQHALRVGRDAVRLFSSNLRNGQFQTISAYDEDQARKLIRAGRQRKMTLKVTPIPDVDLPEIELIQPAVDEDRHRIRAEILTSLSLADGIRGTEIYP